MVKKDEKKAHPKPKLRAPSSMAVRMQVLELFAGSSVIASAAALGVCWKGQGAPRARWRTGGAAEYGAAVIDYFDGLVDPDTFQEWLLEAVEVLSASMPSADEHEEAAGN